MKIEIENFMEHIRDKKSDIVSAREGLEVLAVALKAVESAEKHNERSKK